MKLTIKIIIVFLITQLIGACVVWLFGVESRGFAMGWGAIVTLFIGSVVTLMLTPVLHNID